MIEGSALLRLRVDVLAVRGVPVRRAGDLVLARPCQVPGWELDGLGFPCVVEGSEVEVVEWP